MQLFVFNDLVIVVFTLKLFKTLMPNENWNLLSRFSRCDVAL